MNTVETEQAVSGLALQPFDEMNDETLERIHIGHYFRNDTERLEKLFDLYTKMVGQVRDRVVKGEKNEHG
jgi:hypothetical protein